MDWSAADKAYLHHHNGCPTCIGAGASLAREKQRCPEGARLWREYQEAGCPPHFTWRDKPASNQPMKGRT